MLGVLELSAAIFSGAGVLSAHSAAVALPLCQSGAGMTPACVSMLQLNWVWIVARKDMHAVCVLLLTRRCCSSSGTPLRARWYDSSMGAALQLW